MNEFQEKLMKERAFNAAQQETLGQPAGLKSEMAAKLEAEDAAKDSDGLNDELQAMRSVARTLEKLPYQAQARVVNWLFSRSGRLGGL